MMESPKTRWISFFPKAQGIVACIRAFTLTEMLVTLAVTAILATVALPSYRRYTARARQQEARTSLAAIYSSERTFFADTSSFTLCLAKIGFTPVKDNPVRYYSTGFLPSADTVTNKCGNNGGQSCASYSFSATGESDQTCTTSGGGACTGVDNCFVNTAVADKGAPASYDDGPAGAAVSRFAFTAHAAGNIVSGAPNDHWTIDENNSLVNTVPGI